MTKIICELCGSNDVVKQDGFYVCQHCGTKYSIEEAKKLIGTVKIDKQEESDNLLVLARRAREQGNAENAEKYYGLLLQNDPNNWEASFFQVYFQCMKTNLMNLSSATENLATCSASTIELLSKAKDDKTSENVATIIDYASNFAFNAAALAQKHWNEFKEVQGADREYIDRATSAHVILKLIENTLKQHMPEDKNNIKNVQLLSVKFLNTHPRVFNANFRSTELNRLNTEIKGQDPSYVAPPAAPTSGCYIATAVYGSYDCPEVWTLRRYRDQTLSKTIFGKAFIYVYYSVSPTVVKVFGKTAWFNRFWKKILDKKVSDLRDKGVSATPYVDK